MIFQKALSKMKAVYYNTTIPAISHFLRKVCKIPPIITLIFLHLPWGPLQQRQNLKKTDNPLIMFVRKALFLLKGTKAKLEKNIIHSQIMLSTYRNDI
jgi:hypothetical protein